MQVTLTIPVAQVLGEEPLPRGCGGVGGPVALAKGGGFQAKGAGLARAQGSALGI